MIERLHPEAYKKIKELLAASTQVVSWYSYPNEKQVRGPWGRWFQALGPEKRLTNSSSWVQYADIEADVEYCAAAMNMVPVLLSEIDALRDENQELFNSNGQLACDLKYASEERDSLLIELERLRKADKDLSQEYWKIVDENKDLLYVLNSINERVIPGTSDSADCLKEIIRERDKYKTALQSLSDYEFGVKDGTGMLVRQHCLEVLK